MHAFTKLDDGDIYILCCPNKVYFNWFFRTLYAFHHFNLIISPHFIWRIIYSAIGRSYVKGGKSYFFLLFLKFLVVFLRHWLQKLNSHLIHGQNFHFFLEISQILAVFRFKKSELITKIFAGGVRCGVAKVKTLNFLRFGFGIRI